MTRRYGLVGLGWCAALSLACGAMACSSDDDGGGATTGTGGTGGTGLTGGTGGSGNSAGTGGGDGGSGGGPVVEPSGCEIPTPPELGSLASHSVGTGSAASCDETTLRTALQPGGRIDFDCGSAPVTIAVTETLVIGANAHVDGGGVVTLDGGGNVRILRTVNSTAVILEGLSFQNGYSAEGAGENEDGSGGAIYRGWQADLYVKDCHFEGNLAEGTQGFGGGAIFAGSAGWLTIVESSFESNSSPLGGATHTILSDLTVVDSVFHQNAASDGDGGAIYTDGGYVPYQGTNGAHDGLITICGSRFTQNTATGSAAAGFLFAYRDDNSGHADRLIIDLCEFRENQVTTTEPGLAGAIRIDAEATVTRSLFVENQTAGQGGALWMGRGPATFENVTFYANHADLWGGAISYHDRPITLLNCTVARNVAGESSDGLFGADGATPTVRNTLFYENGSGGSNRNCNHEIQGDRNIIYPAEADDRCGAAWSHEDPLLDDELADNGGFTHTVALEAGSPALDAGTQCPTTDQRGEPRDPNTCDLGAYER